jgi:transglutaminase-like putative cysteine protease
VAPGTIVDWSFTTETLKPVMPGSWGNAWTVTNGRPTRRSRLIVDVPASLAPRIEEWNAAGLRQSYERSGRRVYSWVAKDLPAGESEPFAGWPNQVDVSLAVSSPTTWEDIAHWYAGLARDRYAFDPALETPFRDATAGAKTREDSLRALYRWVAQDIRYVSLSLGAGGYQPRAPAEVVSSKLGDCKDKATLFITLAQHLGAKAYPVLVNLEGEPDSTLPSPGQFDHVIVALEEGGQRRFVDPTAELAPFGDLDLGLQGEFGLLVRPDGGSEHVRLLEQPVTANQTTNVIHGDLGQDGGFNGRYTEQARGEAEYSLRRSLAAAPTMTAKEKDGLARALANQVFDGAAGDSLTLFDGRDLSAVPEISVRVRAPRAAARSGGDFILTLPLPGYSVSEMAAELESHTPRRYPIDAAKVLGPSSVRWDLQLVVPEGWKAKLPANVTAGSRFGTYRSSYRQEGGTVRVERELTGARGLEPPERVGELITWLKAIAADDAQYLVFSTPEGTR